MTDRIKGFTVILEEPMREDDAEAIMDAIRCIRRVGKVEPHVCTGEDYMNIELAKQNIKHTLLNQLIELLK